jgi:hypothetical protein
LIGEKIKVPIKQVVCSICKQTVNKAVTYHVGGTDRACKTHEGVVEKKAVLDVKKQADQARSVQKVRRRMEPVWSGPSEAMKPRCWVCMNTGLPQREFFMRILIEMEKQQKIHQGPVNPFAPEHQIRLKERCIFVLSAETCKNALPYIREDFRMLVDMGGGFLAICGPCCGTLKIEALRPVSWDELTTGAAVFEVFMKPVVKAIAAKELARDN